MKVKWTHTATKHLKGIYGYIAADSPQYARRMIDRITRRSQQLAAFPESGGVVAEYNDSSIREALEGPYRIIYRVLSDRVDVVAVIHGARQLPDDIDADLSGDQQ
ncbi:MAG TPA: type II toxin-antitoxin system RelE/ParE family toxin [Lacipirellula sp.]